MLRFLSVIAALLIGLQMYAVELSEKLLKEQAEYQEDIEEIVTDAKGDVQEARLKLLRSLEKELASVSKKGDLTAAKAIQDRIDELNKPLDGKDLFGNETKPAPEDKTKAATVDIKIKRAFLRNRNARNRMEITEALQALVDAGELKIIPAEKFADKMKDRGEVEFLAEIETQSGVKMTRALWTQGVDLSTGETY